MKGFKIIPEETQSATIVATARTDNVGSVKILEKTGMTLEKEEEKFGHMRKHYRKTVI